MEQVLTEAIETSMEVKPPKRSWPTMFRKLFKRKRPLAAIASSQTPSTTSAESQTKVQVTLKEVQATPTSSQNIPDLKLDEHKINGLRSGGGKFMPCLPSNAKNANLSNVHTLFFNKNHDISTEAEIPAKERGNQNLSRKGCLPLSPGSHKEVTQAGYAITRRGKKSKLPSYRRRGGQGYKTHKGCLPQLGRRCHELEDPKSTRFTYLRVDANGNYGEISEHGTIHSKDLTYLEYKECHRYEPKAKELKDEEMTFLDMDKEGKYELGMELKTSDVVGSSKVRIEAEEREGSKPRRISVNRVYPRTSITSLDLDEDIFQNPDLGNNHGSLPKIDPEPLVRQPTSAGAPHGDMNTQSNSHEPKDISSDDGEGKVLLKANERAGLTLTGCKGCLSVAKQGYKTYFFPTKDGTLKATLTPVDSMKKGVNKSSNDTILNDPVDLLQDEVSKTQMKEKDGAKVRKRCLGFQPLEKKVDKSSINIGLSNPVDSLQDEEQKIQVEEKNSGPVRNRCLGLQIFRERVQKSPIDSELNTPMDLVEDEASKTQLKEKYPKEKESDKKVRNRCLGLQPLKYHQKKPLPSSGLEDFAPEEYTVAAFSDDPWKGEEVAEFELRDFKRLKSKKRGAPFYPKAKKCTLKKIWNPTASNQNNEGDGDSKVDNELHDTHGVENSSGTKSEDSTGLKLNKGCLPFRGRSKRDYEKVISPPFKSDDDHDKHIALDDIPVGEFEMDCTGTMAISIDSDDESDFRENLELDGMSMSNRVPELPWDDSHKGKLPMRCLPFGRKMKDLIDPSTGSEENPAWSTDVDSNDPQCFRAGATKSDWDDDSNGNLPQQNGCLPFGCNQKKGDDIEAKLKSTEVDNVKSDEPQIEQDLDESQWEDFEGRKPKKKCLPFGRSGVVKTPMYATNTVKGIGSQAADQNANGRGEDESQSPLLSEWQEHTRTEQETDWFPSSCFCKKTLKSASFGTAENDPNQVRVDLELRKTDSCLPFVSKSRKGKLTYVQSGLHLGDSFGFELDLAKSLMGEMDGGDETNGDEDHHYRPRGGSCLPLGLMSRKDYLAESPTHMDHGEKGITRTELQGRDFFPEEKKFVCADHIFTLKKQKSTHTQSVADPQNDTESNAFSVLTSSVVEEELHEPAKTGCTRFLKRQNSKKGVANYDVEQVLSISEPMGSATMESIKTPLEKEERGEGGESGKGFCSPFNKKQKCNTDSMEGVKHDKSARTTCGRLLSMKRGPKQQTRGMEDLPYDMEQDLSIPMEDSRDEFGTTGCNQFWTRTDPRRQVEESVDLSGKTSCGKSWMKQDPEMPMENSLEQSGNTSCTEFWMKQDSEKPVEQSANQPRNTSSGKFWMRLNPQKQIEQPVEQTEKSTCGKFWMKQDPQKSGDVSSEVAPGMSGCSGFLMRKDAANHVEEEVDESGRGKFSNKGSFLKKLEETLTIPKGCSKFALTQDALTQFEQAFERSGRASCNSLSLRRNTTNQLEAVMDESGRTTCGEFLKKQDVKKQVDEAVNEPGRTMSENATNQLQVVVDESGRTTCSNFLKNKDANKQVDEAINEPGRTMSGNATNQLEVVTDESTRTTCGKVLMKQDSRKQSDEAVDKNERTSWNWLSIKKNPREQSAEEDKSGMVNCGRFFMKQDARTLGFEIDIDKSKEVTSGKTTVIEDTRNQIEDGKHGSGRASCTWLSMKQDATKQTEEAVEEPGMQQDAISQLENEVNESGTGKKCNWLPLKQGENNRLEEAVDKSGKTSCGAFSTRQDQQKPSEEVAQENQTTDFCVNVFSFKRDPAKEFHAMTNIEERVENSQHNPTECAPQGKISSLFAGFGNQKGEATYFKESEAAPLISNEGRSKKWFLKRYCACMAVSDHSSAASRCNYEAPDTKDSINKNPTGLQKSEVGVLGCMHCFPRAKVNDTGATPETTSHTFDCVIQSNIQTFPVTAHVTDFGNDPNFEAQKQQLLTPENKDGCKNSKMPCSCWSCPIGHKDCVISQMNPFGKYASQAREDEDLEFSAMAEMDPLSQQLVEDDDKEQHVKTSGQKSNRERWFPSLGKYPELGIFKPFNSRKDPGRLVSEMESSRSDEQDGHPSRLEKEPEILKPFVDSREGPEHKIPKMEARTGKHDGYPRIHPGVLEPASHSCHRFRLYKTEDISQAEVSSTAKNVFGDNWKHFERSKATRLPPSSDSSTQQCLGDSLSETEDKRAELTEPQVFTQQYPENNWLRGEGKERPAEEASSLTDKLLKDDDNTSITTKETTTFVKNFSHNDWPRFWQKGPLPMDLLASTELYLDEEEDTSQTATNARDSDFQDCWESNHNKVTENKGFTRTISPVPPKQELTEVESQEKISHPEDERALEDMYSRGYGYKGMEENPNLLTYDDTYNQMECSTEDEQFDVGENPLDSNHKCLGRNWQKQESIEQALEASETLLKKLLPLQLPQFENSGQDVSSSSGLSQTAGTCCLMSLFQPKEKRKPKQVQTKDIDIQTNETLTSPKINTCQMTLVSRRMSLDDTFLQETQQRKKQRTMCTRRNRGYSTPVGELEGRHTHSSRKALEAEYVVRREPTRLDLSPGPSNKKNESISEVRTDSAKLTNLTDPISPNWERELEVQMSSALILAANAIHDSYMPLKPSVNSAQREIPLERSVEVASLKSRSQNRNAYNSYEKPSSKQQLKSKPSERKKRVLNKPPACALKSFPCARWTSEEDSEGVKHPTQSVSVPSIAGQTKSQGRTLNTYSKSGLKRSAHLPPSTSATDASSSDEDDIYDIPSKEFRDNLFKNNIKDNCLVTESVITSKALSFTKEGVRNYRKTTEKEEFVKELAANLSPLLQKFENSDQFSHSPVFKELVRVESQMREIARIITGIAGPEYLDAIKDGNESSDDDESIKAQKGQVSVYSNPIWFAEWKEPVSVQMATRLVGDEVPVYYDDGFKVGYIPKEHRGCKGMRKTKKAEDLETEYNKFINQKIKPPSDDDDTVNHENQHNRRRPTKKPFSQKFTAKGLLHGKLHPHDHRGSGILVPTEAPEGGYSSSSSSWSWKEDLIQSHRRVFCRSEEAMSIRKKSALNGDSDSDDSQFPSPRFEMPSQFMGQVDEEVARLKLARQQVDEGLYEPPPIKTGAAMPHKLREDSNDKEKPIRVAPHDDEDDDDDDNDDDEDEDSHFDFSGIRPVRRFKGQPVKHSTGFSKEHSPTKDTKSIRNSTEYAEKESLRGRHQRPGWTSSTSVRNSTEFAEDDDSPRAGQSPFGDWMGECMSPGKSREGSPSKVQSDLKNKEFLLLERRVRKELGGKRKMASAKPAQQRPPKEEMIELSKKVGGFRSEPTTNLGEDQLEGKLGPLSLESNQGIPSSEKSSLVDDLNCVPVSSLVKLMFGPSKTSNHGEGTQESSNKIQVAVAVIQKKVGALETEIAKFQENNRRLGVLMKENTTHMSRLMQERATWELQKNSEMEALRQYKEAQMNKLQKERFKMEHQTRVLRQTPTKGERKECEELKAKLAGERDLHLKKELQWRQTTSRLQGVNNELKNQIQELRKEIGWHEDRLLDTTSQDFDNDSTTKNSKQRAPRAWNTGRCTSNQDVTYQPREEARKERNGNSSANETFDALQPTKFKVEIIKKNQQPTRVKVDVVKSKANHNDTKHPRDNPKKFALDTLSSCEDSTTTLGTKMKELEKEVDQWIKVHSHHCNQKPT